MTTSTVDELNAKLNTEKARFADLYKAVEKSVSSLGGSPAAVDALISYADEYGVAAAATVLVENKGDYLGFSVAPKRGLAAKLKPVLTEALASSRAMDTVVMTRETLLQAANPKHNRVYILFGREFTINADARTMSYVGGETVKLEMSEASKRPGAIPSPEPEPELEPDF